MEDRTREIIRRGRIQDSVVVALYATAAIAMFAMAPNTVGLLKYLTPYVGEKNAGRRMSQAISRLIRRGYLRRVGTGAAMRLAITPAGKRHVETVFTRYQMSVAVPKRWDGRWRIVMFDIWERRRDTRDRLRYMLQKIGFRKLQHSVWVYPYDCEEVVALIRAELRIGSGATYLIADALEGENVLRKHFELPLID